MKKLFEIGDKVLWDDYICTVIESSDNKVQIEFEDGLTGFVNPDDIELYENDEHDTDPLDEVYDEFIDRAGDKKDCYPEWL